jgi:hypothetical protein
VTAILDQLDGPVLALVLVVALLFAALLVARPRPPRPTDEDRVIRNVRKPKP